MPNLNVAVLAPTGYAKDLGKKGTASDITFYNLKRGEDTVTLIEPTRYPERLAPLFYTASMADRALLVIEQITPTLGEWVLMLQALSVSRGYIILKNYLTPEQVKPLIRGTVLEQYDFIKEDMNALREQLLREAAENLQAPSGTSAGTVPIDHHFNVKGIGTVILGGVVKGIIRKHDTLKLYPGERGVLLRSIQKHDDDSDHAVEGDRVGIALKNIDAEDLDRGYVLSSDPSLQTRATLSVQAELVAYWPAPLKEGMVLHIGHWLQFIPAKCVSVTDEGNWRKPTIGLELEKELVFLPGDRAVLHYLEGGKLRIAGTISL